ncbi:MAG: recombinase family protein [Roseburia sp.]|nr:recombinase family protein [Roseburia sp.]
MNIGYARLSRDDDRQNYISIENQKLIITQAAAEMGRKIDCFYEDDGFSGYRFNRPGFVEMMKTLEKGEHTVFIKDLSRLGRNNGKMLLLLDELKERGIRLISVDDAYDNTGPEDDIIGIKTWYNERYVKEASRKIRRVLRARQKEGTLFVQAPFGYIRDERDKGLLKVIPEEAECIRQIYDLYLKGLGYRRIAAYLSEHAVPTPSMVRRSRELAAGRAMGLRVSEQWSDGMVRDILGNDFYMGTYRLHKRERKVIHGSDCRVPKEEQYVWEKHHQAIIEPSVFRLVQEIKEKRNRTHYRGSRGNGGSASLFGGCLFCRECGGRLTPIVRKSKKGIRRYYICSTYNTRGRQYCSKAHLIEEQDLTQDIMAYLKLCCNALGEVDLFCGQEEQEVKISAVEERKQRLNKLCQAEKASLKVLLLQKARDIAANPHDGDLIDKSYQELQQELLLRIHEYEKQLQEEGVSERQQNAGETWEDIVAGGGMERRDVEILIDRILVDENGFPEIQCRYALTGFCTGSPSEELNSREKEIIRSIAEISGDNRQVPVSGKHILKELADRGIRKSVKELEPYMRLLAEV